MAEKQEFYKLINDKTKVPRLTPIPQIDHLKNERLEKTPLLKFRAHAMRFVKPKPPPPQPKLTEKWKSSVHRLSKTFYTNEFIKLAKAITVQGLLPEWEENILNLIPKTYKRKHFGLVISVMKEVKQDYLKEMQNFTVKNIVNMKEKNTNEKQIEDNHRRRTSNEDFSSSFDVNRKLIYNKYFLSHPLIKNISKIMFQNLPKNFINFERFKTCTELHISKLYEMISNDLQRCSLTVRNQCYNEIVECLLCMNDLKNYKRLSKLLHCAESFMVQQILNSMMNSINSLIEALKNPESCPQLKIQLLCRNDALETDPKIDDIYDSYDKIIDDVTSIAQDLVPLGEWLNISGKTDYIKVKLPEWFLEKARNDLREVLVNSLKPLSEHYEFVSEHFGALCSSKTKNQISRLIAKKKDFEIYCNEVNNYNKYLSEINAMVTNIYYSFGILNQTLAINDLKENTSEIINMLINELIESHQELNRSICMEFENLESRALSIPDDTKSLFELTDYVSYASKILVKDLEKRIKRSVQMLYSLLEIAILSTEHIELNKTTINWLELIKPVFSQHNIFCEAKKGELEDELQRKINVLSAEIDAIFPKLVIIDNMDDAKRVFEYKEFLSEILKKIDDVDNQIEWINMEEKLFKFPETTFPKVDEIKEVMSSFCSLVHIISQWQKNYEVWMDGPFEYLDAQVIEKKTLDYFEKISDMHKMFKVKIKSDLTSHKPFKFSGIVDDPDPLQQPAPLKLCWQVLQSINEFKKYVPLTICMCNPALEKRHWDEMSAIAGMNLLPNAGTTLRKIIAFDLLKDFESYEAISIGANKELALQKKLNEMIEEWRDIKFFLTINEESNLPVFTEEDKIEVLFEEQFIKISEMRASYFITPIESKVVNFNQILCHVRDTIEYWNSVQEQCKYLNSFFENEIIQNHIEKKFETEFHLYNSLKSILKSIEQSLSSNPSFYYITKSSNILEKLKQGKYALELIKAKIHEYFEELKLEFTRLFFMSDEEMIKLLFEYDYLTKNKSHLQKCFPNIVRLKMDQSLNIHSIVGEGGEELQLENNIPILQGVSSVTHWLKDLNKEMVQVIGNKIDASLETFNDEFELSLQWISNTPAMVIFCVCLIIWTSKVEICIYLYRENPEALKICRNKVQTFKEAAQQFLKINLSRKNRETITSLIVLFSHQEEITNMLIEKKVRDIIDFDWKAQIRYYYKQEEVEVRILETCIEYGYEYYSSSERIIINTPLTDRCYRSIMEAYRCTYFGTIVGFSCVGKTETIKNLARTFAMPLFTFSGDERQDYNCISNIFKGLVSFNAWIYFKNFTRIKEDMLSLIAQYIFRISQSKSMDASIINIDGTQLIFNPNCNISFCMNPALSNVSGVPDNLKLYFRTVSFMKPDFEKICEIELFAAGYDDVKNLTKSLVQVYNLCNDQMSSEKQYDLNLRNIKAVIATAAKLKFIYPDEEEQVLILRSLFDLNISKFVGNEIILFQNILNTSFPNVTLPPSNYDNLLAAIEKICSNELLSTHDTLKLKVIQLYEMIHLKQSIILVGDPLSGKSTILRILKEALLLMRESDNQEICFKINCQVINPGALSVDKIYGFIDEVSGDWKDGICSDMFRNFIEKDDAKYKWLIFDGNMHSSWIERLETVLDDNKTLFLASNERIILTQEIKIFFETLNLYDICPSTVSRCGIVHIDSQSSDWRPFLLADIINIDQFRGFQQLIYILFDWSIDPCLEFIHNYCTVNLVLTDMHLVMSTLNLFKLYMNYAIEENIDKKETEKDTKDYTGVWCQAAFIMAINWTLTGTLDFESKQKFEGFYTSLWNNLNENHPRPIEIKQFEVALPTEGKLLDNIYIFKQAGNWKYCGEILKTEKIKEDTFFQEPFIPTIDNIKLSILCNLHIKYQKPFILCGESSCGKTSFFQNFFTNLPRSEYITNHFNFNSIKYSDISQKLFLLKLNKIKRYNYEPSKNRFCINLIDDLNAMSINQINNNSTVELIRQYMDYGFWYDLKDVQKVNITNTMFIGSLNIGRQNVNKLCSRFLRHFNVFTVHPQSKDNTFRIFSNKLLINFKKNSFAADVLSSINSIVNSTIEVYLAVVQQLRPIPTKILYRFSLHDVQRIIKGCSLIHKESVETKIIFIRLWAHETYRVFGDRIIDDEDKQWLFTKMRESVKLHFKDTFESAFDYLPKYNDEITKESFKDLFFGNFMDSDISKRKYEDINSTENLKNKFLQYMKEYNETNKKNIDIVMTCHAIQHLIRLCRILATPGGSLLMISSSGSGRKSLIKLAAFIQQQCFFEPMIDIKYNESSWKKDIKSIMMNCGTSKKDHTFLITDRYMRTEFINDINSLLTCGEIPQLFSSDEEREIIKSVRLDAQKGSRNLEISMASVLNYFFDQCKQKLHFVININPIGNTLRDYLREYPTLMDRCTINWFDNWPEKALEQIAIQYMKDINIQESVKSQVICNSKYFYNTAKQLTIEYYEETRKTFHIMPTSFIRTMNIYTKIISKKQEEIKTSRKRYLAGLDKLQLAAREVAQMKNTLTKLRPQLEASARQTEATMKEIENENISVERATILVKRDEEIANKKAEIAGILKAECEAELAVAIPILEDAIGALNTLKPTDITLVKAMKNPPDTVKLVMAAVCVMLSIPSERVIDPITGRKSMDFWGPSKRVLGDMNFLQNLKDYDKDNIPPTIMSTIKRTYMSDKNFMPHIVVKASSAAEGLCKWVRAMVSYDEVAKVVAPKKEKLAAAQKECDETEAFLNAKRKTLADLNMKLAALKGTLEATLLKKLELEKEVENCTIKLKKAESLIASLSDEKVRWMDSENKLGRLYNNLPGDALLSSATIIYLSSISLNYREKTIIDWKGFMETSNISFSEEYEFVSFLGVEIQMNNWHLCGLSNNQFSLQNAIIMENSPLWCLFIDPQTQASEWITKMEEPNNLQIVKVTDSNYMDIICKSMELGNPVLLENLEQEIDVSLDPFLSRDTYRDGENWYLNLRENSVLYSTGFRFYLTTKYPNPCYPVDVFNKVKVIDFLLPGDALRDRLLDIVISREKPELQEKFEKVLKENINIKRILKQQEDIILHTLSASNANILEDEGAIKILDSSKSLAVDLMKRQEATRTTKEDLDEFRETYSQFTKYCADLYNTLNMLPNLDHMYRFSLPWFTQLYMKSIETAGQSAVHKKRIDFLKVKSITNLHESVHNALFEKHKLIYSFILSVKTLLDTDQVTETEFNLFMSINEKQSIKQENGISPNPASSWLPDRSWREVCRISKMSTVFQNFPNSFRLNSLKWKQYGNTIEYDECPMPLPWHVKLTLFQKLFIIRILYPDKIIFKITEFVECVMKVNNCYTPCIKRPYEDSSFLIPLILILPSYSSPFTIINEFAKKEGRALHSLSMGPFQEQKAELLIEIARKKGEWVFLHNCHLALPWITKLEKMYEEFGPSNTDSNFRLWISTQSNKKFPIGFLQNSIKIALDAPYDVKQTLLWTYKTEPVKDKTFYDGCPGKDKIFSKLLYGFSLFHAVIRERKNYGLQGWNFQYDFDESDLHMSINQLQYYVNRWMKVSEKLKQVPFKALVYFLSECNYGGKIIDIQDKVYLDTLVLDYCNIKVINTNNYDFDIIRTYRGPRKTPDLNFYLGFIQKHIPIYTSPENLQLDKNVSLTKNNNRVKDFLNSLSSLNETAVIYEIESKNNQVKSIILAILETLPENFNVKEVQEKCRITDSELLNYVLMEEVNCYNKCLSIIRNSLQDLKNAFDGHLIWSKKLEEISEEIFQGLVPKSWKIHISLCTKKLLSKFIPDLIERVKFINNWIDKKESMRSYWFGGLMSCKRLLMSKKMIFAKEKQVPIDKVVFDINVLDIKESAIDDKYIPNNTIYVYGLYLLGARWDEQEESLRSSLPKVFYNHMPVISFTLTLKENINSVNFVSYKCPLYVSPSLHNSECNSETLLDNYILSVNLKSNVNPKLWIKRGTALYCQAE